jgi:serine/threonine protein kinase
MPRSHYIGPYRILRLINQGGQGSVYLGFDDRLHRRVAIKIVQLPKDKAARKGLLHEARLAASIHSAKVVQIYDLIVATDHVAFIMEYEPGCDLEEFLAYCSPSLPSILAVSIDIAGALAASRQQQIVHGDLKASNVLITRQGRAKLTDFGVSREAGDSGISVCDGASISSVSPEQYRGEQLDIRSDLFALGCLMYRMLSSKHPFIHAGELDVSALLEGNPRPIGDLVSESVSLPSDLVDLLASLMQKQPGNRPNNTHELRNRLRAISRQTPLSVGNTLLSEAEPCFREESSEDVPPIVPADLTHNGRSGLRRSRFMPEFMGRKYAFGGLLAVLVFCGFFGSVLVQAFFPGPLRLLIQQPTFTISADAQLPPELSPQWLVKELEQGLRDRLSSAEVLNDSNLTRQKIYFSNGVKDNSKVQVYVRPSLHCADSFCLLELELSQNGIQYSQQKLIFSNTPISSWAEHTRSATLALLEQSALY